MGSEGFIQDPATKETKRFHRDEKSWTRDPKVFVDTGLPIPGEPPLLHLRRDAAEQLWRVCIALAGYRSSLVGEPLLSLRNHFCAIHEPCQIQRFCPAKHQQGLQFL